MTSAPEAMLELPDLDVACLDEAAVPNENFPTPAAATSAPFKAAAAAPAKASRRPSGVPSAAAPLASRSSNKSKKKKGPPLVSMASAPSSSGGGSLLGHQGENTGRWTAEEHRLFLQGLEQHGKGWKKIASLIKSRTVVQIRTHAQKYFQKLAKCRQEGQDGGGGAAAFADGRGGANSTTSASTAATTVVAVAPRRRRLVATGTKRKALQSIVASAQRQGKKLQQQQAAATVHAASSSSGGVVPDPMAVSIAPALAYFVLPDSSSTSVITAGEGLPAPSSLSGPSLEDSL